MTRDEILDELKQLAATRVKVPVEQVREDASILEDLGLDSLTIADLIISTEERFGFEFEEQDLHRLKSVGSLLDVIQARCAS